MPSVIRELATCNTLDAADGFVARKGSHSRHRRFSAPERADRRVIFPSLHTHLGARRYPDPHPKPNSGHDQPHCPNNNLGANEGDQSFQLTRSHRGGCPKPNLGQDEPCRSNNNVVAEKRAKPFQLTRPLTNVDATTLQNAPDPIRTLMRATSLDGILIPLPRLSLTEVSKPNEEFSLPMQRPISDLSIQSALPFETKTPKSHFLGDKARHGTYYPAASIPAPVGGKKYPPRSRPLTSVLRRRKTPLSASTSQKSSASAISDRPTGMSHLNEVGSQSPRSLCSDDSEGKACIGKSESDLQLMPDFHKILPHKECKLECLAGKKPIIFNPRVVVFEFVVTNYETKGGGKWWTEDELKQFKQGAMNRICLLTTKLIPTGTGRFLAVAPAEERSELSTSNPRSSRQSSRPILFNHPALGCDDEFDPGSRSSRNGPTDDTLLREKHAMAEIRHILLVETHEMLLKLFTKSLKQMIPHASVATARSAEGALTRIEAARKAFPPSDSGATHGFDILIIEENLRSSPSVQNAGEDSAQHRGGMDSGSALIRYLDQSQDKSGMSKDCNGSIRCSLLVGASALMADRDKLEKSGADCVWGKPLPEMNERLRNKLLGLLMKKRNRMGWKCLNRDMGFDYANMCTPPF